jgi:predicted MFS family arabinose efflux permease
MSDNFQQIYTRPAWQIIVLAIAPAIGLGICRFAYALVPPDMRESLGWSWSMAGLMNTVSSAGYLIGAIVVTLAFSVGQTLGPIATGAITDAFGSLSYALNVSAAMLVAGVVACMIHTIVTRDGTPRTHPLQHGGNARC